jgi:hypothetical protein
VDGGGGAANGGLGQPGEVTGGGGGVVRSGEQLPWIGGAREAAIWGERGQVSGVFIGAWCGRRGARTTRIEPEPVRVRVWEESGSSTSRGRGRR